MGYCVKKLLKVKELLRRKIKEAVSTTASFIKPQQKLINATYLLA
jgi:hypothetical protein